MLWNGKKPKKKSSEFDKFHGDLQAALDGTAADVADDETFEDPSIGELANVKHVGKFFLEFSHFLVRVLSGYF